MTQKQHSPATPGIVTAVQLTGSQAALAEQLRSRYPHKPHPTQQAISQWVRQGFVPAARAKEIAAITGVAVAALLSPSLRDLVTA